MGVNEKMVHNAKNDKGRVKDYFAVHDLESLGLAHVTLSVSMIAVGIYTISDKHQWVTIRSRSAWMCCYGLICML